MWSASCVSCVLLFEKIRTLQIIFFCSTCFAKQHSDRYYWKGDRKLDSRGGERPRSIRIICRTRSHHALTTGPACPLRWKRTLWIQGWNGKESWQSSPSRSSSVKIRRGSPSHHRGGESQGFSEDGPLTYLHRQHPRRLRTIVHARPRTFR